MTYRNNVSALAAKLGISNDPSLREEDILVATLIFRNKRGEEITIAGTEMNRGGRLFFQNLGQTPLGGRVIKMEYGREVPYHAYHYFAELWRHRTPGQRPLLDAIESCNSLTFIWKGLIDDVPFLQAPDEAVGTT